MGRRPPQICRGKPLWVATLLPSVLFRKKHLPTPRKKTGRKIIIDKLRGGRS